MRFVLTSLILPLVFSNLFFISQLPAQNWPGIRGSEGTGVVSPGGILAGNSPVELNVAWKKKIGSGYTSPVVADSKVVVLYCNETNDLVACLNADDGETIWTKIIGPKFVGKNGSFDGPISTPLVDGNSVFVLNPTGMLFSFDLKSGQEKWKVDLQAENKAPLPLYGFTTSPVVLGDKLFVMTGAEERMVAAFEASTGKLLWEAGNDSVDSQIPFVMDIEGNSILLAPGGKKLTGLDTEDGAVLFEYNHGGGNGSAVMPVPFDGNKLILTVDDSFSKAISLRFTDNKINVSEEWQERSIKNTYNIPAVFDSHAYAYSTRILTSVDTKTGRPNWKSRKPGDGFLIVVDGHLIMNTKKGDLFVVKASPDSYQEVAGIKLFDDLVWSLPAFSNDSIYVRSMGEIARVNVVSANEKLIAEESEIFPVGPRFQAFIRSLEYAGSNDERTQIIAEMTAKHQQFPIIENDIAHFLYRGPASDIALASDVLGARQERKMIAIPETDCHYYAIRLPSDQRANYAFLADFEMKLDPLNNKRVVTSTLFRGEMEFAVRLRNEKPLQLNWFGMNDWEQPDYLDAIAGPTPRMEKLELGKTERGQSVACNVLLPPGYQTNANQRFPVVYVLSGSAAVEFGAMGQISNHVYSKQAKAGQSSAAILVFTDNAGSELTEKIVPAIDDQFRTIAKREGRSVIGNGFTAGPALTLVFGNLDKFSAIALQSPLVFEATRDSAIKQASSLEQPIRVYLEWGRFDMFNPHENWDMRKVGMELHESLQAAEKLTLEGGEVQDTTDWSSWRNRTDKILRFLTVPME